MSKGNLAENFCVVSASLVSCAMGTFIGGGGGGEVGVAVDSLVAGGIAGGVFGGVTGFCFSFFGYGIFADDLDNSVKSLGLSTIGGALGGALVAFTVVAQPTKVDVSVAPTQIVVELEQRQSTFYDVCAANGVKTVTKDNGQQFICVAPEVPSI